MNKGQLLKSRTKSALQKNNVTILFVVLCIAAFFVSGTSLTFLLPELFTRIGRNTFMVLSLIIPVVAGIGLNFGIVIGAIAAQIGIFFSVLLGFKGIPGLLVCILICTPLAILFGWAVGALFNRMKGTEMIGGLVAGYFSDGIYQLFFLFILGGVIPINAPNLMISTGVGVLNTIDLRDSIKYVLDNIPMIAILDMAFWGVLAISAVLVIYRKVKKQDLGWQNLLRRFVPIAILYGLSFIPAVSRFLSAPRLLLLYAVEITVVLTLLYNAYRIFEEKVIKKTKGMPIRQIMFMVGAGLVYAITYIPSVYAALIVVHLPVFTYLCILGLYLFIPWLLNTKLGQDIRTVGQSRAVAASSGIDVDKIRIISMIISTVLASYGQLVSLQNIGTMATYGSHQQVGLYAIAALLVGGASVDTATAKQAVLGVILFHTLFILSPIAGTALMGNAQIGEYFRVFIAYGVIALSLAMHARSTSNNKKTVSASTKKTEKA